MHDSAVASVSPRARQSASTSSSTGRSSSAKRYRSSGSRSAAASSSGTRLRARLDDEVDVDLEVARADRRLDARRRRRRPRRAPARPPTRSRRRSGARAARAARARASSARTGSVSSARGQSRCSSPRRAGQDDRRPRRRSRARSPGAVPASPSEIAPSGSVACLRTPVSKSAYGRRSRSAIVREIASISSLRAPRRARARARPRGRRARRCGRRGSGRARRRRRRDRPRAPRASAASSSSARSPTIAIRAGSKPSASACAARNGPFRSVRSPRTSSLPVTTMTARGRLKRASGRRAPDFDDGDVARAEPRPQPPGLAVHDQAEVLGGRGAGSRPSAATKRCLRPCSSVPTKSSRPVGGADVHLERGAAAHALERRRPPGRRSPSWSWRVDAAGGPRFGIFAVPDEPPNFHAAITSAVITPIPTSVTITTFDSTRRWARSRRRPSAVRRARNGASSSAPTKRELYSST